MPDLKITFTGMVLVGHGDKARTEAWLVDTNKVPSGKHKHAHTMTIAGTNKTVQLGGGVLVSFVDGRNELGGAIDMANAAENMVDLDVLLPDSPLRSELLEAPVHGGSWKNLLAAWVRLPGGTAKAKAQGVDTWPFPGGDRTLSEELIVTAAGVQEPAIRLVAADGTIRHIEIPLDQNRFGVTIKTVFAGTQESAPVPEVGQTLKLDEVQLLYGCLTGSPQGHIPERQFTIADRRRIAVEATLDPSVCPNGLKRLASSTN